MAASILSSIVFFLLFVIFSLLTDEKAFAAHMEHRKLSVSQEIMTTRRNLQGNGGAKIGAHPSKSDKAGSKTQDEPSKTHPDQAKPQENENITPRTYMTCTSWDNCTYTPISP
ncbi:unnamed protein product [Thlaspi arvense]|uniref:CLV3/ESR-related protein n=1 Tax=Thlaspi arvense TaxID=13288 RepID=A0AAU9R4M2_THLAR|nr:unnamed protein product [Thlaspi arvense]